MDLRLNNSCDVKNGQAQFFFCTTTMFVIFGFHCNDIDDTCMMMVTTAMIMMMTTMMIMTMIVTDDDYKVAMLTGDIPVPKMHNACCE